MTTDSVDQDGGYAASDVVAMFEQAETFTGLDLDDFGASPIEDDFAVESRMEGAEMPPELAGAPPQLPRDGGYDVEKMNERYALVLMGSKAVVLDENPAGPIEDRHAIRTIEAFHAWHSNAFTETIDPKDGKIKVKTHSARWMGDRKRRQYNGLVFFPNPDGVPAPAGYFNLWRGYSRRPEAGAGSYAIFKDHLLNHVCSGSATLFQWVFGFFAHILQRPRERVGTALVLRGKMGAGKTIPGEVFGELIASHYFLVDDPRYITGQFNAHMASCLLLQAEEAVWAGDKAAEGRLKGLVTSKFQMIEAKGIDPIRLDNFVRLIMTSNEDWVVPAGKDERRFCVLDVSDAVAQNHAYFAEMNKELEAGGREALLADLLAFDMSKVNLRSIPMTGALLEQKLRSLTSVESWWFERLQAGSTTKKSAGAWQQIIDKDALHRDYIDQSDMIGVKRRSAQVELGMGLKRLVPSIKSSRPWLVGEDGSQGRSRCWILPPLRDCRRMFEEAVGQQVEWDWPEDE